MATEKNAKKTTEVATTGGYGEIAKRNWMICLRGLPWWMRL